MLGEAALLAFTFAQTRNAAIGVLVLVALVKLSSHEAGDLILSAFMRGLRAAWLPEQSWEKLLSLDVEDVRQQLRVGAPATYTPLRSNELRAAGLVA